MTNKDFKIDTTCKYCGSTNTYMTQKYKICRKCGHREELSQKEVNKNARDN